MALKLFIDNDVILKLAQYGILEHLPKLFTRSGEIKVSVLDSARYKLLPKQNPLKLCKSEEAAAQITTLLDLAQKVSASDVDLNVLEQLNAVPGIDAGEALLFAAVAADAESVVLTGDKRALTGLGEHHLEALAPSLRFKVITLEGLIQGFVELDHSSTQHAIRSNPAVDKALSIVFGLSAAASEESVQAGLSSYVGHIRNLLGEMINNGPPF
ncbi:hypothetical protein J2W70_000242 [Pseudomonas koreensis]|uniref:hypothetical protein n=1 Tax=Pseudomonas koreensis TaxID=198620 RepID=UPI002859DC77|nr:hypothetical protein [Pseudomonas koreensis]MDR7052898.1 hypothetical protein [Pseudomonas koreensis]